jgi:hypothetical protein
MTQMQVNSWFNAKRAKSGSMGYAWAISPRIKFMMMITIANNVDPNYTSSFSSGTIIFSSILLFLNLFFRKLAKRPRQASAASRQDPANSRVSRSHSPGHLNNKQPSKRRNTMNSRDAAFDESLKEIIEATAAEAAAVHDSFLISPNETEPVEGVSGGKKKRKRADDDR